MKQRKLAWITGSPPRLVAKWDETRDGWIWPVGGWPTIPHPGSAAPSPNSKQSLSEGVFGLEGWLTSSWAEAMYPQRFLSSCSHLQHHGHHTFIVEVTVTAQWELWEPFWAVFAWFPW